jgi:hypothetical protein
MPEGQRKIIVVAAVFLAGLLAGIKLVIFLQARPQSEPDTSRLMDLLHRTAQKEISLPPLADAEVELTINRAKLDEEIERIKSLAARFGGTAIQGSADADGSGTDVLAEISPEYTSQFLEALKHPEVQPSSDLKAEDKQAALVEVRLKFEG